MAGILADVRLLREECLALREEIRGFEVREGELRESLRDKIGLLTEALDHMPDPVLLIRGREVVHGNPAYLRWTGEDAGTLDLESRLDPTQREAVGELLRSVRGSGAAESLQVRLNLPWGHRTAVVFARRLGTGAEAPCLLVLRDVTESGHRERQLRLAEMGVVESPVALALIDGEGTVLRVNPAFESLAGWLAAEVEGRPWGALLAGGQDRQRTRIRRHVAVGRIWIGRLALGREGRPFLATVSPVRDPSGELVGAVARMSPAPGTALQGGEGSRGGGEVVEGAGDPDWLRSRGLGRVRLEALLASVGSRLRARGIRLRYGLDVDLPPVRTDGSLLVAALCALMRGMESAGAFVRVRVADPTSDERGTRRVLMVLHLPRGAGGSTVAGEGLAGSGGERVRWLERIAREGGADVRVLTGATGTSVELRFQPAT